MRKPEGKLLGVLYQRQGTALSHAKLVCKKLPVLAPGHSARTLRRLYTRIGIVSAGSSSAMIYIYLLFPLRSSRPHSSHRKDVDELRPLSRTVVSRDPIFPKRRIFHHRRDDVVPAIYGTYSG